MNPANIVDAHVHLWNPARLRYAWLDELPALNRAFLPADFTAACAKTFVRKMIFVECGREPAQALAEVDWVCSLAKQLPSLRGIVAHAALEKGRQARVDLMLLANRPLVKGVRRLLQAEADEKFCLRRDFVAGVQMLVEFGFTFDLCLRHDQLPAVTELVRRVPEVQFVLDHCGKPPVRAGKMEPWATDIDALAKLPNVSCKLSGLTTEADWKSWRPETLAPYVETVLAAFGYDRVLFGGDWPVCTLATDYTHWLEAVTRLTAAATEKQRQKLFQTNAEKIYRI